MKRDASLSIDYRFKRFVSKGNHHVDVCNRQFYALGKITAGLPANNNLTRAGQYDRNYDHLTVSYDHSQQNMLVLQYITKFLQFSLSN